VARHMPHNGLIRTSPEFAGNSPTQSTQRLVGDSESPRRRDKCATHPTQQRASHSPTPFPSRRRKSQNFRQINSLFDE